MKVLIQFFISLKLILLISATHTLEIDKTVKPENTAIAGLKKDKMILQKKHNYAFNHHSSFNQEEIIPGGSDLKLNKTMKENYISTSSFSRREKKPLRVSIN